MPSGGRRQNRIIVGARAISLPRDVTPFQYYQTLLRVLDTGSDLPEGWEVELRWQNPDNRGGPNRGEMQYDDFADAIAQSNEGFRGVVRRMLAGYVMRYRYAPPPPPPPPPKRKRRRIVKPKPVLRRKPVKRVKPKPRPKPKVKPKRVYKRDKRGRFVAQKKRRR
jgi:hypothetical protein